VLIGGQPIALGSDGGLLGLLLLLLRQARVSFVSKSSSSHTQSSRIVGFIDKPCWGM
jgi:hypothetical protein